MTNLPTSGLTDLIPAPLRRLFGVRFDKSSIQTVSSLVEFVHTRSAYVAQTSLYGYLKTRMGTRFRQVFEDDAFQPVLNASKWRTYGSCLADLSIFAAATSGTEDRLDESQLNALARLFFETAVAKTFDDETALELRDEVAVHFSKRLAATAWSNAADGENSFSSSPRDLLEWAPVIDQFKELDEEIVVNSTRFRWRDIREQLRKRIDRDAICADWLDPPSQVGNLE